MLRISIIELKTHGETIVALLRILREQPCTISIYIEEHLAENIKAEGNVNKICVRGPELPRREFLEQHLEDINGSDFVLINTLQKHIQQYRLKDITARKILRLHNIHAYLNPYVNIRLARNAVGFIYDLASLTKHMILGYYWHKPKLLSMVDFVAFPSAIPMEYALSNNWISRRKTFGVIPLTVSAFRYRKPDKSKIRIVVPGAVDRERRDYKILYLSLAELLNSTRKLKRNLELIFLGNAKSSYGHQVVQEFQDLVHPNFKFRFFHDRVPDSQYESIMMASDYILAPLNIQTRFRMIREQYGLTKVPGVIAEVVRYSKPLIVPFDLTLDCELEAVAFKYRNQEGLTRTLWKVIENAGRDFSLEFEKVYTSYSPDVLGPALMQQFQSIVNIDSHSIDNPSV